MREPSVMDEEAELFFTLQQNWVDNDDDIRSEAQFLNDWLLERGK